MHGLGSEAGDLRDVCQETADSEITIGSALIE